MLSAEIKEVWKSADSVPAWLYNEPSYKTVNGIEYLFFVGVSGEKVLAEQDVRTDAEMNAIKRMAHYVGVNYKEVTKRVKTRFGQSGDIVNPTINEMGEEELSSEAYIRFCKSTEWYIEKYWDSEDYSTYYKAWILSSVPKAEIEQIIRDIKIQNTLLVYVESSGERYRLAESLLIKELSGSKYEIATLDEYGPDLNLSSAELKGKVGYLMICSILTGSNGVIKLNNKTTLNLCSVSAVMNAKISKVDDSNSAVVFSTVEKVTGIGRDVNEAGNDAIQKVVFKVAKSVLHKRD